ncbi:unnamed protein product [Diabrotica balteata]|uniref:Chitin-binding type-2 domain-containing protein n=1 Tax=Diabrotica balteata TaxID=107213 RepID=A0A9N9T623_DIABA|nr:unnamed protein product [Diabrotica balteata]
MLVFASLVITKQQKECIVNLLALLTICIVSSKGTPYLQFKTPDPDCIKNGTKYYPDPYNCTQYYVCDVQNQKVLKECTQGKWWNDLIQACDVIQDGVCCIERIQVYLKALMSVLNVIDKRLRRVKELKIVGQTPEDKRGKSISRSLHQNVRDILSNYIKSFPLKESHYSGKKICYLSADLNFKKMWTLFCEPYSDGKVNQTVYWRHFK